MQRFADLAPAAVPQIWSLLSQIPDPEIPVLTITDLVMVRSVTPQGEGWAIGFTPTYSGCPATDKSKALRRVQDLCHAAQAGSLILDTDHDRPVPGCCAPWRMRYSSFW